MLSFFRVSTAYKYAFWFLLLLVVRLPVVLGHIPVLNPEIKWAIVAEQIHKGFFLYTDVWDNLPPLSALVYSAVYAIGGRNFLVSHLIATALVVLQAILYNQILQDRQVYNERTLLPAVLYGCFMSLFLDFYILSAPLLANTFLMIALNYIFLHLSENRRTSMMFEIGAYIGIATLFYFPSWVFLIVPMIAFPLYTPTPARDYGLMLIAFLFTIGIAFLGFFLTDSEYNFWLCFFASHLSFQTMQYLMSWELLAILAPLCLLMLWCIAQSRNYKSYTNYQDRSQNAVALWFWASLFSVIWSNEIAGFSFMPMMLALTFAFTHFVLQFPLRWVGEAIFVVFLSYSAFFTYTTQRRQELRVAIPYLTWADWRVTLPADKLIARSPAHVAPYKGKRIWVSGTDLGAYQHTKPATPYLNAYLAERHLQHLDEYNTLSTIYKYFLRDMPEVVIDQNGRAKALFAQIPLLARRYELVGKQVYILKKK